MGIFTPEPEDPPYADDMTAPIGHAHSRLAGEGARLGEPAILTLISR
nr:hypothetical protein JVH1_4721 [Rhodococcus sp. JVH1]